MRALKGLAWDGVDAGLGGDGLWRAPRSGALHGPSLSCCETRIFRAQDEDLNGAEVRTLKRHVGVGWLGGDARVEGLGGDGLWRAPRSGVLHGPSPTC